MLALGRGGHVSHPLYLVRKIMMVNATVMLVVLLVIISLIVEDVVGSGGGKGSVAYNNSYGGYRKYRWLGIRRALLRES